MNGLVKIADAQTYNLNHSYNNREDRLKDDYDRYLDQLEDLESQRDPEVEDAANAILRSNVGKGFGIGSGIGAIGGGVVGAKGAPNPKSKLFGAGAGALVGGLAGGILGLPVGAIVGDYKSDAYREMHEDPELLGDIAQANAEKERVEDKLQRHYLMEERIRRAEEERVKALGKEAGHHLYGLAKLAAN